MLVEVLVQLVPQLMERIDHLEADVKTLKQSKETMGHAMVKLVKKVKKMERLLKRRKMVILEFESEEAAHSPKQGRNLEASLEELVKEHEDRPKMFVTPTQSKSSGEAAAKDISPGIRGCKHSQTSIFWIRYWHL